MSHAYLGILIDARLVLDVLGSVGIAQRADGLIIVVVSRAYVGNHHRLCVATQRILQGAAGLNVGLVLAKPAEHDSRSDAQQGERDASNDAHFVKHSAHYLKADAAMTDWTVV